MKQELKSILNRIDADQLDIDIQKEKQAEADRSESSSSGELGFKVPTTSLAEIGLKGDNNIQALARRRWVALGKPKSKYYLGLV